MSHGRYESKPDDASLFELTSRYPDEHSAILYFENQRWPDSVTCPKCSSDKVFKGHATRRLPLWNCRSCGHQFTVTSGTVMEDTKLPLRKWLFAFHLMGGSKKGISARYLARTLGVTVKTAWHLSHRIRATMTDNDQLFTGIVETDETYIGGRRKHVGKGYRKNKIAVQTIVERNGRRKRLGAGGGYAKYKGRAQTIALDPLAERVDGRTVGAKLRTHTDPSKTHLMTDQSPIYEKLGESFKSHDTVNHKKEEYVRKDPESGRVVTTNTAEGLFANLKRQITGTHHHTSKKHLPRYLEEYDYKYNTRDQSDGGRTVAAIKRMAGRRVTLFKSESGKGDSLFDRKVSEKAKKREKKAED